MAKAKQPNRFTVALDAVMAEVAREYEININTHECEHVATHLIAQRHILARMLRGDMRHGDVEALKTVDALLAPYKAKRDRTQIRVNIVEGVQGTYKCTKCGCQNYLKAGSYTPLPDRPQRAPSAASPVEAAPAPEPVPAPAAEPPKAEPAVMYRRGFSESAFHSQVVNGSVPPLKRDQLFGTGHRSVSPMSVDGHAAPRRHNAIGGSAFDDPNPTRERS